MFYSVLGRLVWALAKRFLRRKYGATYVPKPVIAVAAALTVGGVLLAVSKKSTSA